VQSARDAPDRHAAATSSRLIDESRGREPEQSIRLCVQRRFPCLRHPTLSIRLQGSLCVHPSGANEALAGERISSLAVQEERLRVADKAPCA
jgi:hypothetical protein